MNSAQLWTDTLGLLPEILLVGFALLILVVDFVFPGGKKSRLACLGSVGVVLAIFATLNQAGPGRFIFARQMSIGDFTLFFRLMFLASAAMCLLISVNYLRVQGVERGEYYALVLFASAGLMIMAGGTNFLTIYLGLELTAISSYILCGFLVNDKRSSEAALKYFILGVFASGLMMYGISLIYGFAGSINLYEIGKALASASDYPLILTVGMILLITGFGFKIAAVPFHMWAPDVYEGAPTPVAAFISVGPKVAAAAALLRVLLVAVTPLKLEWSFLFSLLAAATVTLGNIMALRQDSVKRMLAYSGITHVGYALIGVVACATSPQIGSTSVLVYFMLYFMANMGAFGVLTLLCREGNIGETYEELKGLGRVSPMAAMFMSIFILSLLGIPPTGGFVGKLWVFAAAIKADIMWLAVVGVVNAIVSSYYYLRVMVMMYMHEPAKELKIVKSRSLILALAIMALVTLYMGISPGVFFDLAQKSIAAIL
jgi:NADH-quinone oxidoreductase subunit N